MRIIPFPSDQPLPGQDEFVRELESALAGDLQGPGADAWRQLREDVRALAEPMSPAFQARLEQELARRTAASDGASTPPRARAQRLASVLARHRRATAGGAMAAALALVATLVLAVGQGQRSPVGRPAESSPGVARSPVPPKAVQAAPQLTAPAKGAAAGSAGESASGGAGAASAPGRVQQQAASITLAASPTDVQAISDQVAQLSVREGGYVQSSNVHVQQQGTSASSPQGEATLSLRIPSAHLIAALASIGRLAAVRSQSQSLEDITSSYEAAHRQLEDALAERSALLRALAAATTEGQIDSLRERLVAARGAIARAQASLNSISHRASTAEVEVSIVGTQGDAASGLTLHSGLHDAGRVLVVALIVILIGCAVLVPLALVAAALVLARNWWRRHQRERALG